MNYLWYNKVHVILNSSRVYCPCILGAEMPETRISIVSPLLALPGWEAGITNNHTPTMDTTTYPHVVSSRKRTRADISHSESHDHDENEQTKQKNTNENWPRFIVLESPHPTAPLSKISPFTVVTLDMRVILLYLPAKQMIGACYQL